MQRILELCDYAASINYITDTDTVELTIPSKTSNKLYFQLQRGDNSSLTIYSEHIEPETYACPNYALALLTFYQIHLILASIGYDGQLVINYVDGEKTEYSPIPDGLSGNDAMKSASLALVLEKALLSNFSQESLEMAKKYDVLDGYQIFYSNYKGQFYEQV